jgi:hypothetical protein
VVKSIGCRPEFRREVNGGCSGSAWVDLADRSAPSDCQGCQKDGDRLHEIQTDHMGAFNYCFSVVFFSTHVVEK